MSVEWQKAFQRRACVRIGRGENRAYSRMCNFAMIACHVME